MDDTVWVIYCLCDDLLQALRHYENPQCEMSDAEVMTTALVAALFWGGNYEHARRLLGSPCFIPHMLSKSRLNRRLHRIAVPESLWLVGRGVEGVQYRLGLHHRHLSCAGAGRPEGTEPQAKNIRIRRARLYRDEAFRGYIPSKRRYFYGLRLCLLTTGTGEPVEAFLAPGSMNDTDAVKRFSYDLPEGSTVYADRGCTDYTTEDLLEEAARVRLSAMRKKGSTRPVPPWIAFLQFHRRKMVETAGSLISQLSRVISSVSRRSASSLRAASTSRALPPSAPWSGRSRTMRR